MYATSYVYDDVLQAETMFSLPHNRFVQQIGPCPGRNVVK
jgi:hypothetical protein